MGSGYLVYMSIRKFLGFLVPGFALATVLYLLLGSGLKPLPDQLNLFQDKVISYVIILIVSYMLGAFNIQVTWRILDIIGGWSDSVTSRWKSGLLGKFFGFCSARLHIFSIRTLREETAVHFPSAGRVADKEEYSGPYWDGKMLVLDGSPALAKEAMEIEGDINLYAGMFAPLILLGIFLARVSWTAALISVLVAAFFALRFQHLRHDDIAFVAHAAQSLREARAAKTSPDQRQSSVGSE